MGSDWKPIETAPKDGTNVFVSTPNGMAVATYGGDEGPEGWFLTGIHWASPGSRLNPTHWMPLPEPPDAPK